MSLSKLIEAVEAGLPQRGWPEDGLEDGLVWTNIPAGIFSSQQVVLILSAYNGSLDAAHSLHQELLPGWTRSVDATTPDLGIVVVMWPPSDERRVLETSSNEARAWLLAILRAKKGYNP